MLVRNLHCRSQLMRGCYPVNRCPQLVSCCFVMTAMSLVTSCDDLRPTKERIGELSIGGMVCLEPDFENTNQVLYRWIEEVTWGVPTSDGSCFVDVEL